LHTFSYYTPNALELFNKITWVEGDLMDVDSLEEALEGVRQVYHAAAFISFNPRHRKKIIQTNVEGTANLVNLSLDMKIDKLCFVSSIASLGVTEDGSEINENIPWKPTKHEPTYPISKLKSEMEVWRGITEGLNAIIINPSVVLGPGNWRNGTASIIDMISKGMPFYTKGTTGFVDARDVAEIMVKLMESEINGERFILSSENLGYKELFDMIAQKLGVNPPKYYFPPFLSNILGYIAAINPFPFSSSKLISKSSMKVSYKKLRYSSEKIIAAIDFKFRPVKEVLDNIVHFYQEDKKSGKNI